MKDASEGKEYGELANHILNTSAKRRSHGYFITFNRSWGWKAEGRFCRHRENTVVNNCTSVWWIA